VLLPEQRAHRHHNAGYLLYFAAAAKYVGCQCIGVAHSMFPSGPYRSASSSPLICPSEQGGAIDPSPYITHTGDRCALSLPRLATTITRTCKDVHLQAGRGEHPFRH